jgi:uncharacterized protein (TIGR03435 family)
MRVAAGASSLVFLSSIASGQSAFDVASVKPSERIVGKDYGNQISIRPTGFSGRNVTLKRLIEEVYRLQPHQVSGALNWLDLNEYDVEAKVDAPTSKNQLLLILRTLLTDRFRLAFHHEEKELRVYELVVDKGGAKIQPVRDPEAPVARRQQDFHGDMQQFANLLALKLTAPPLVDVATPSLARGTPTPVLDKTRLAGIYDISVDLKLELGVEMFTIWQRVLQDQLGLKLESRKANVDVLVVDRAERIPTAN